MQKEKWVYYILENHNQLKGCVHLEGRMYIRCIFVTAFIAVMTSCNLRDKVLTLVPHSREGMITKATSQGLRMFAHLSGSRNRRLLGLFRLSPFLSLVQVPYPWRVHPALRMSLLSSVKPLLRHRCRHIQICVSLVILNPTKQKEN